MKIYLRHTRDEKVMNLVKISTNHMLYLLAMHLRWKMPSQYDRTHVHAIIIL